ncbi:MAG: hypothetical protein ACI9VS_004197, partial [Candidatus Binatia bacterium]
ARSAAASTSTSIITSGAASIASPAAVLWTLRTPAAAIVLPTAPAASAARHLFFAGIVRIPALIGRLFRPVRLKQRL